MDIKLFNDSRYKFETVEKLPDFPFFPLPPPLLAEAAREYVFNSYIVCVLTHLLPELCSQPRLYSGEHSA